MEAFSPRIPCAKEERFGENVGKNWKHHTGLPKKREPFTPGRGKQNAEIQQGFTRVLKDALRAMVSGLI